LHNEHKPIKNKAYYEEIFSICPIRHLRAQSPSAMSGTSSETRFDRSAGQWDAAPHRVQLAVAISKAVQREMRSMVAPRLLDYGAGTGLVSLPLAPLCSSVLAVDSSAAMLAKLEEKAVAAGIKNVATLQHNLETAPLEGVTCDVLVCSMTLHHVRDVKTLLTRFRSLLSPDGFLAIADLDKEDGSFHQEASDVHHFGFRRDKMETALMDAGFTLVTAETVHRIEKTVAGQPRSYPIFLMTGRSGPS
jgi:ubiquinone/menaquinone biosynthesis C-methylase UbiE